MQPSSRVTAVSKGASQSSSTNHSQSSTNKSTTSAGRGWTVVGEKPKKGKGEEQKTEERKANQSFQNAISKNSEERSKKNPSSQQSSQKPAQRVNERKSKAPVSSSKESRVSSAILGKPPKISATAPSSSSPIRSAQSKENHSSIKRRSDPRLLSYNKRIAEAAKQDNEKECQNILAEIRAAGLFPDAFTFKI